MCEAANDHSRHILVVLPAQNDFVASAVYINSNWYVVPSWTQYRMIVEAGSTVVPY